MTREKVYKADKSRAQRLIRLIASTFDPRAFAHGLKILNYYNYTHVQQLREATVGKNVNISPTVSFANASNIIIRDRVRIGANSSLWAGPGSGKIVIDEDALIAPNVMLTAANYRFNDGSPVTRQLMDEGDITVGRDVWIGYGAVILAGVTLGDGAIIGAGAVVRDDVPANGIVVGERPQVISYRRDPAATAAFDLSADSAPNPEILDLILRETKDVDRGAMQLSLDECGIDSFDLMTLRTAIEAHLGNPVPDREWAAISSLSDIARLPSTNGIHAGPTASARQKPVALSVGAVTARTAQPVSKDVSSREYVINMPQMALGGLSEAWLFKELGDLHWAMITDFLGTTSSAIADDAGDRLYATFTRIQLDVDDGLGSFKENEPFSLDARLERFGATFFFGNHEGVSPSATCRARTMSTFAKYGERGANTSLVKGSPSIPDPDVLPSLSEFPEFGTDYRAERAMDIPADNFACEYEILPPHDINGVGLLYFAAYPTIFDLGIEKFEGKGFLLGHSTIRKDIFYFANSEPTETLIFRVHDRREVDGLISHTVTLARKSDGKCMAKAYCVKKPLS